VTAAVAASNETILVKGDGFVAGWSRCLFENGNSIYQVDANVLSRYMIECQKPSNESSYLQNDTIVKIQIQNYFNDEMNATLRSHYFIIESERAIFEKGA
jgi:hypothetical protein